MSMKTILKVGLIGIFMCNVLYANTVRITSKYANIRSGAGTDYRKIGEAHQEMDTIYLVHQEDG